ncbi:hypothetical protein LCGC14_0476700 [marine sediment metagenome]|uniref:Uncharacterized protein n=1 Tax=marine sediment metagenome TaxID=412755 RepID=A0A0F9STJ9_9ZZZZ|nr:hypothetical protein [bacterium]
MKQVFASYHFTAKNGKLNGFGNYLGEFDEEIYERDMGRFILDLEKTIANQLLEKISLEVQVKILYFR